MKAAVLHAFDEKLTAKEFVKYEDVTDPKISRPMDVIVRIGGAGVCRTDLHIVEGIWRSKVDVKLPYIMGHENAGWVEAIGPGVEGVKVGDGGLGHIGIQVLAALCAAEIIVIDRADKSLELAKTCGAHHLVKADGNEVEALLALTGGRGAEAVIDFVGEGDAIAKGLAMTANGGSYYIVGYGGKIDIPTIDMVTAEKTIVGNLVGTYAELVELMALADRGLVTLHTKEYKLNQANDALHDLHHGRIHGRAVLIP